MQEKLRTLRGWGRASAAVSESEKIEDRFNYTIDDIPYDKKLAFAEMGFNMQVTEIQGAFGVEQMKKLPEFVALRKINFDKLCSFFKDKPQFMIPKQHPQTETSWINFPLTLTPDCPFSREEIVIFLEKHDIQTRPLFSGNITRHPAFRGKKSTPFKNADYVMKNSFMIGCHQALTQEHLNYIFETFDTFLGEHK
jgi:CDP-6-deoxy-D-xylo-4-hexulose-3-dehydrase